MQLVVLWVLHYGLLVGGLLLVMFGLMLTSGPGVRAGEWAVQAFAGIAVIAWIGLCISLHRRLPADMGLVARLAVDFVFLVIGWPTLAVLGFVAVLAFNR